jgi:hypothetical protein
MDIMKLANEERLFTFLKEIESTVSVIASISSSPFLLAEAGLLKGRKYTVGMLEGDRGKPVFLKTEIIQITSLTEWRQGAVDSSNLVQH